MTAEIELTGGSAFQRNLRDMCRKVQRGTVVRVVHVQTGRHRGWLTRERPGGCEPVRISVWALGRTPGQIFDDVRGGQVYQIWDASESRAVGYLYWAAEPWLAELLANAPMTYVYRAKSGRVVRRDFFPLSVQAEPVPPWTGVLANA